MDLSGLIDHLLVIILNFIPSRFCNWRLYFLEILIKSFGSINFSHSCVPIGNHLKIYSAPIIAIVGAEYVLRWLPIGTHEWEKFVKPEDLKKILMKYDLSLNKLEGMNFNIIKDEWNISKDLSINYIGKFIKN